MLRFTEDDFDSDQALTIGVDFKTKVVNIDGVNVKLGNSEMGIKPSKSFIDVYIVVCSHLGYCRTGEISNINTKLLSVSKQ